MTPVIFLTVLSDDIYEEAALAGGAVDFIDKSRRLSILVRRIELIAEGQRPLPSRGPATAAAAGAPRCAGAALRHQPRLLERRRHRPDADRVPHRLAARDASPARTSPIASSTISCTARISWRATAADGYRANVRTFIKRIRKKFRDVDQASTTSRTTPASAIAGRPGRVRFRAPPLANSGRGLPSERGAWVSRPPRRLFRTGPTGPIPRASAAMEPLPGWRIERAVLAQPLPLEDDMGRGILLWLLGVPIPVIILIMLLWH